MSIYPNEMRTDAILLASTVHVDYRRYVSHMLRNRLSTACGRLELAEQRDSITNIKSDIAAARKAIADMLVDMKEVLI